MVTFKLISGDLKGKAYRFTLARQKGQPLWSVTPLYKPAPSMLKEQIDMALTVRENNVPISGAVEMQLIGKLLENLSVIAEEDMVIMTGLDKEERYVRVGHEGYSVTSAISEANKEPEYQVNLTCWSLYKW